MCEGFLCWGYGCSYSSKGFFPRSNHRMRFSFFNVPCSGSWISLVEESRACYLPPNYRRVIALENWWKSYRLLFLSATLVRRDFSITWLHHTRQTAVPDQNVLDSLGRVFTCQPGCRMWDNEAKLTSYPCSFFS